MTTKEDFFKKNHTSLPSFTYNFTHDSSPNKPGFSSQNQGFFL